MIAAAALLAVGCAHQAAPGTPVYEKGHASPELLDRVDRGEFKAYEVDPATCDATPQADRDSKTIIGSCPTKP